MSEGVVVVKEIPLFMVRASRWQPRGTVFGGDALWRDAQSIELRMERRGRMAFEYRQCEVCGEWGFVSSHRCAPRWRVWIDPEDVCFGGDREGQEVHARDAEEAAEQFGAEWDNGNYVLVDGSGQGLTVLVSPVGEEESVKRLVVEGEMVPEYTAREISEGDGG